MMVGGVYDAVRVQMVIVGVYVVVCGWMVVGMYDAVHQSHIYRIYRPLVLFYRIPNPLNS